MSIFAARAAKIDIPPYFPKEHELTQKTSRLSRGIVAGSILILVGAGLIFRQK